MRNIKWDIISCIASVLGLLLSSLALGFSHYAGTLLLVRDMLIFIGLFSLTMFLLIKNKMNVIKIAEYEKDKQIYLKNIYSFISDQFKYSHNAIHELRNYGFLYYIKYISDNINMSFNFKKEDRSNFEKYCHVITMQLRWTLQSYFEKKGMPLNEDIAITIKMIIPSKDVAVLLGTVNSEQLVKISDRDYWIITAYRDPITFEKYKNERDVGKVLYDIKSNTAFNHILLANNSCYFCNDLQALGVIYMNKNPNWGEQYNSVIVVPIRYYDKDTGKHYPFGILAADSKNPQGYQLFDEKDCKNILAHSADMLAMYLLNTAWSKISRGSDNE
ncbi:MAG: hypothetical protein HQL01_09015 [Nitrospirae bacterium]|nr:hypothetical protein [Nitrospirota bacterium]